MNIFGVLIVVMFFMAAIHAACLEQWAQFNIYLASDWLNIVFLIM